MLPHLRIPSRLLREQPAPRQLTSVEVIRLTIMWRVSRQALALQDVDPILALLAVPQQLLLSEGSSDRRIGKEEGEYVNSHRSAGQNRSRHSQQVPGRHLLSKPHRHSRGGTVARSCAIARAACGDGREHCQQGRGTIYGLRCPQRVRTNDATADEAEKLDIQQLNGTFEAIDVPRPPDFHWWFAFFTYYRAILFMFRYPLHPSDLVGMSRKVVTLAALDAYPEAFRVLIGESQDAGICFAQQQTVTTENPSFGSGDLAFSSTKAALRTGSQSTNAMGCGLRVSGTPCRPIWRQGGGETSISIYHQRFIPRHSWHPWSLWARSILCNISLLHQGSQLCQMDVLQGLYLSKVN